MRSDRKTRRGFTLIEVALVIVIVGVGVVASAELLAMGTKANADAHRLTTALNLAGNVRESLQGAAADEILALDGKTFSPPIDARQQAISGLDGWVQSVTAVRVMPDSLTNQAPDASSRLLRLTVKISHNGRSLTTEHWLLADTTEATSP